jgi:hypothetical protein
MMMISTQGKMRYYTNLSKDHFISHQLPLSAGEYITSVKFVNATQTVIGSSAGELYLLNTKSDSITASTFYRHNLPFAKYFFKYIPHVSEELRSASTAISSIRIVADLCFISDQTTISIWQVQDLTTVKV